MMKATNTLHALSQTDLRLAEGSEDIRGRRVFDAAGQQIGNVDDLILDDAERRVRFLRVGSGGFLGIGETKFLIPAEAIARIDQKGVHVDITRERVAESPPYDPEFTEETYWDRVYQHYGRSPYWGVGAPR